jgi:hypothetical protein
VGKLGNVIVKRTEVVFPFIIEGYASATIRRISLVVGICASANDMLPTLVMGTLGQSVCFREVCAVCFSQASTAMRVTIAKVAKLCGSCVPAVALAKPNNAGHSSFNWAKCHKVAETISSHIQSLSGESDILGLHKKLTFLVSSLGRSQRRQALSIGHYSSILTQAFYLSKCGYRVERAN